MKVAIIDDDASVRTALHSLLRSAGLATAAYESAEAFLAAAVPPDPDCIIADVQMPGLGGLDLLELLAARGEAVPAILVTAFPSEIVARRASAAGALRCFNKPFDANEMIRCVRAALSGGRRNDPPRCDG